MIILNIHPIIGFNGAKAWPYHGALEEQSGLGSNLDEIFRMSIKGTEGAAQMAQNIKPARHLRHCLNGGRRIGVLRINLRFYSGHADPLKKP